MRKLYKSAQKNEEDKQSRKEKRKMADTNLILNVNISNVDEAIEKANQLVELLTKAQEIINSLSEFRITI